MPVNAGGVKSSVHVMVLAIVDVLLQPSVAVNVLVLDLLQPVETTAPSLEEILVIAPHASVAVAVPNEASGLTGLHPNTTVV